MIVRDAAQGRRELDQLKSVAIKKSETMKANKRKTSLDSVNQFTDNLNRDQVNH